MITIIASTNRENSYTLKVAKEVIATFKNTNKKKIKLLDLSEINFEKLNSPSYLSNSEYANNIREKYFISADQLIFIIPEYNGSFPGILKYFIDLISTKDYKKTFSDKTAALIGVAQGRAGNLRGLTHFTSILMHMGINVIPKSLPLSEIDKKLDEEGQIIPSTKKRIQNYLLIIK